MPRLTLHTHHLRLASFPGPRPASRRLLYRTASDGKLGGDLGTRLTYDYSQGWKYEGWKGPPEITVMARSCPKLPTQHLYTHTAYGQYNTAHYPLGVTVSAQSRDKWPARISSCKGKGRTAQRPGTGNSTRYRKLFLATSVAISSVRLNRIRRSFEWNVPELGGQGKVKTEDCKFNQSACVRAICGDFREWGCCYSS